MATSIPLANGGLSLSNSESVILNPVNTNQLQIEPLKIMPIPVKNFVAIQTPKILSQGIYKIMIFDSYGKLWYDSDQKFHTSNRFEIPVQYISSGIYWIHLKSQEQIFQGKFIKN